MTFIPVFKPGTHTAVDGRTITFTLDNCVDLAESYDPSLSEAPAVIGHPKLTAPAYGWAKSFKVKDGLVYADLDQINPAFAEAFNAGSYKKRSLSIYLPDSPGNPKPGHYYARHIGFLGAAAPAIKGLPDASFAESNGEQGAAEFAMPWNDDALSVVCSMYKYFQEVESVEYANELLERWMTNEPASPFLKFVLDNKKVIREVLNITEENEMPQPNNVSFAEQQASIDAKNADLTAREKALHEKTQAIKREELVSFADGLIKDGKLLPIHKTSVVEVFMTLSSEPISFAEGETTVNSSPAELIKKVLTERPAFMDFAEKSGSDKTAENELDNQDPKAIADAAKKYQKEQADKGITISISEAVAYVAKEKKQ